MHKLDSRLRKLEGGKPSNVTEWLRLLQHDGESKDDFQARVSRTGADGVNIIARSFVGPMERAQA